MLCRAGQYESASGAGTKERTPPKPVPWGPADAPAIPPVPKGPAWVAHFRYCVRLFRTALGRRTDFAMRRAPAQVWCDPTVPDEPGPLDKAISTAASRRPGRGVRGTGARVSPHADMR